MKVGVRVATIIILLFTSLQAQNTNGDVKYRARNDHAGNLIRVTFHNHGMMGSIRNDNSLIYAGEWPINSGMVQMGNASSFVGSELRVMSVQAYDDTTFATITPVIFCQGWDANVFAHDSLGNFLGFEPLPGYYNLVQKEKDPHHAVAMSHEPFTWPAYWPDKMEDQSDPGWRNAWNGYFGKDQKNADQESFYVMDDYQFKKKVMGYDLPLPIQSQPKRGGLGLKQQIRGLQWANPDAEDCIFLLYDIKNIGQLSLNKTVFGLNVGASIGALMTAHTDWDDDCATFYREIDLTVNYDWDNIGTNGYTPVPWVGFAFLESPGNPYDGIDNDGDAYNAPGGGHLITVSDFYKSYHPGDKIVLINYQNYERTVSTMPAVGDSIVIIFNNRKYIKKPNTPLFEIERNGFDDNLNGLIDESDGAVAPDSVHYYLYIRDPVYNKKDYLAKDYITGAGMSNLMIDERRDDGIDNDQDWNVQIDDVGLDGKSATGDEGEGDGIPTPGRGDLPGEPNIDKVDVDESDQIGLTSFIFYEYGTITYSNDQDIWQVSRPGFFDGHLENVDADYIFSCGYFPLLPGQKEFFSVAMIYGWDEDDIIRNKNIVQDIYNANYNFAIAPELATLKAVAGDKKVTLYWDDRSEYSFDRYLRENDFEGYKIYRSQDPGFSDAGQITDAYGYAKYVKPLAIYDKVDSVFGFFPLTFGRGVQFNLGNESGLVHTYVDSPLVNGKTYYYAVCAYDKGDAIKNISPSETNKYITLDASGEIRTGLNVVAVVPNAPALGYEAPASSEKAVQVGTNLTQGEIWVHTVDPALVKDGQEYEIQFLDQSMDGRDNDMDGKIDGQDNDELLPTLTTGMVLKNLTLDEVVDTVWFFDYGRIGDTLALIRNIYDDNDANSRTFTTIVNGLEFFVYNPAPTVIDAPEQNIFNGIHWSNGVNYETAYDLTYSNFDNPRFYPGVFYPRQLQIRFHNEIVGTSDSITVINRSSGKPQIYKPIDVNFEIFDSQTGEPVRFGMIDRIVKSEIDSGVILNPGFFSAKDQIIFTERLPNDSTVVTMCLVNNSLNDTSFYHRYGRLLGDGDTLSLYYDFPFNGSTRYRFTTSGGMIASNLTRKDLNKIKVVPNPYVVTAEWEPKNPYSNGRGPRLIKFIHLPQSCTIRIFSIDGSLVRKLEHHATMTDGSENWDLLSKDNMEISYGVYIYHVQAPGIGEKIGRILIIK
jgi:hypothetical protein